MFLSKVSIILVIPILLMGIVNTTKGAQERDPCTGSLPFSLEKIIKAQYPDWTIVNLKLLSSYHKKLYLKNHKGKCPGIVKLDFYGDGSVAFAIVLTKRLADDPRSNLIIGRQIEGGQWQLTTLDENTSGPPPVVVAGSPGKYEEVYREKTIKPEHEVIVYIGYESWAVLYFWNGKKIEELQISD